jgi:S1-C subfamily serine protease
VSTDLIRFNCPTCQKRLVAKPEKCGKCARCSGCLGYVFVPLISEPDLSTLSKQESAPNIVSFTVEHDRMLDFLKKNGTAEAGNPKTERILADIAAVGFATKKGNVYVYGRERFSPRTLVTTGLVAVGIISLVVVALIGAVSQHPKARPLTSQDGERASASKSFDAKAASTKGPARQPDEPPQRVIVLPSRSALSPDIIFERASPAVVHLIIQDRQGRHTGDGSGFLVSRTGLIATNYHVIKEAHTVQVMLADGTQLSALGMAASDERSDLAIIKAAGQVRANHLELAGSELPQIGAKVYAIGTPLGVLANTLSDGIISGHRSTGDMTLIQTTAAISPGSSGGPLLSSDCKVVGVTTGSWRGGQNLNLAVPASRLSELLKKCGDVRDFPGLSKRGEADLPAAKNQKTREEEEREERRKKNEERIKAIQEAIEELDTQVRWFVSKSDWASYTNPYRLGKLGHELHRDTFFEALTKWRLKEEERCRELARLAATYRVSIAVICRRTEQPLPQDYDAGAWRKLRDNLRDLDFRR